MVVVVVIETVVVLVIGTCSGGSSSGGSIVIATYRFHYMIMLATIGDTKSRAQTSTALFTS